MQKYRDYLRYCLIGVCLGVALVSSGCGSDDKPKVPVGKEGILFGSTGKGSPVAVSDASMDEFLKANSANDRMGISQMLMNGSIFVVDNGTRVLVIDHGGMFKRKIRILEGEMQGRAGYVPYEWIKPIS